MKIIYFGSDSSLSLIPFLSLIKSKHELSAFVYDNLNSEFAVINTSSIQSIALNSSISLLQIGNDYTKIVPQLRDYRPDVILVSCYARLLPQSIISIAKYGCFNLHPSLLPQFRGPTPIFWQFKQGVNDFGITLHRVTVSFDDGSIVAQKKIKIEDGLHKDGVTELLASESEDLILNFLAKLESDTVTEREQNDISSSYYSYPKDSDYTVSTLWTAKRIYNFIKAYKDDRDIFYCESGNVVYTLTDVHSYQSKKYSKNKKISFEEEGWTILECDNSYLVCKVKA